MRAGLTVAEFWDSTPRETALVLEAAGWRNERAQKEATAQAWRIAALTRAKRLPALKRLLSGSAPPKPLAGRELDRRRKEFAEMTAGLDLKALAERKKKKP